MSHEQSEQKRTQIPVFDTVRESVKGSGANDVLFDSSQNNQGQNSLTREEYEAIWNPVTPIEQVDYASASLEDLSRVIANAEANNDISTSTEAQEWLEKKIEEKVATSGLSDEPTVDDRAQLPPEERLSSNYARSGHENKINNVNGYNSDSYIPDTRSQKQKYRDRLTEKYLNKAIDLEKASTQGTEIEVVEEVTISIDKLENELAETKKELSEIAHDFKEANVRIEEKLSQLEASRKEDATRWDEAFSALSESRGTASKEPISSLEDARTVLESRITDLASKPDAELTNEEKKELANAKNTLSGINGEMDTVGGKSIHSDFVKPEQFPGQNIDTTGKEVELYNGASEEVVLFEDATPEEKIGIIKKGWKAIKGIGKWFKDKRIDFINNTAAAKVAALDALELRRARAYETLGINEDTEFDSLSDDQKLEVIALEQKLGKEYIKENRASRKELLRKKSRDEYPEGPEGEDVYYRDVKARRKALIGAGVVTAAAVGYVSYRGVKALVGLNNTDSSTTSTHNLSGTLGALHETLFPDATDAGVDTGATEDVNIDDALDPSINREITEWNTAPNAFTVETPDGGELILHPTDIDGIGEAQDGTLYSIESGREAFTDYDPYYDEAVADKIETPGSFGPAIEADSPEEFALQYKDRLLAQPNVFTDLVTAARPELMDGLTDEQFQEKIASDPAYYQEKYVQFIEWAESGEPSIWDTLTTKFYEGQNSFYTTGAIDFDGDGDRDLYNVEVVRNDREVISMILPDGRTIEIDPNCGGQVTVRVDEPVPIIYYERPTIPESEIPPVPPTETVPPEDTVPPIETVPPTETVPPEDTVPPEETVPPTETVPPEETEAPEITPTPKIGSEDINVNPNLPEQIGMGEDRVESGELQNETDVTLPPERYDEPQPSPSPAPAPEADTITTEEREEEITEAPVADNANSEVSEEVQQELQDSGAGELEDGVGNDGRVEG